MGVGTDCGWIRDELSARLDGEDDPANRAAADAHLTGCAACAAWWEQASAVTRLARTTAALPSPGLSDSALAAVLAAAPAQAPGKPAVGTGTRDLRVAAMLRALLLAVGLGQFMLGVAQISSLAGALTEHAHTSTVGSVSSGHLWHESAAWNVAIGAALAWLAWRKTRPAALLPVMTAFVGVLALLTVNDALAGRVDTGRILSHGLVLAGYALLILLNLSRFRGGQPPVSADRGNRWAILPGDEDGGGPLAPVYPFPVRVSALTADTRSKRAA
jgi:predicted anti-sigma-YlaC factor YlaD